MDVNRPMRLRSGRKVLGELTNNKTSGSDRPDRAQAKKPRLQRESTIPIGASTTIDVPPPLAVKPTTVPPPPPTEEVLGRDAGSRFNEITTEQVEVQQQPELAPAMLQCDVQDKDDPLMVTDYIDDLYEYYKRAEVSRAPTLYMHTQKDINARMRAILVDWLVEVHMKFALASPTLHLCIHLIDSYCSKHNVRRCRLQLVGVSAFLIASKYEEIYPPEVKECVYITDHAYTRDEVLEMERVLLEHFQYNVSAPTNYHFVVRGLRLAGVTDLTSTTANRAVYFCERCLQEHSMLAFRPSLLAAAAVYLSLCTEGRAHEWGEDLVLGLGYTEEQVKPCARQMCEHVGHNAVTASKRPLHAVRKKFESSRFGRVAFENPPMV